jgi:hypothetical protein
VSVVLRQWCPRCQAATVTWTDPYGRAHCSGCEPAAAWCDDIDDDDWDDDDWDDE